MSAHLKSAQEFFKDIIFAIDVDLKVTKQRLNAKAPAEKLPKGRGANGK